MTANSGPIAIVGSGCRFPGGSDSPSSLWELLHYPRDVLKEIPSERFNIRGYYHPDGTHHGTTNVRHSYMLVEDLRVFDASFFNISANEAESIDPQQRLLMETVYEAMESGGHTIEALRDSDTEVYVGVMAVDYHDTLMRDVNSLPTYFATGISRSIISNRISYFFDWHGPSMTIDTACSSSMVAVHLGVQALRTGESRVAVACGTELILGPENYVAESKMNLLSPTGRSRMWDAGADGYARGDGVATVIMKRLDDAIRDGVHVECLIRETGINQDGRSAGLTVPSSEAQAALIRRTYTKAGLNLDNPRDWPQFFEAHGTGTKAGDPREAAAIYECFGSRESLDDPYMLDQSRQSSAIRRHGVIPPNMFDKLNPAIEPYCAALNVPTRAIPWPCLPDGAPRRVSVNSFGFGGSNAHAIIESYQSPEVAEESLEPGVPCTPVVFSANSEASLVAYLRAYSDFLDTHNDVDLRDLAWTTQSRRSVFPIKASFSACKVDVLASKIDERLAESAREGSTNSVGVRSSSAVPRILGIFTGQGAQWPMMGAELIRSSTFVRARVLELDQCLSSLPEADRPQWNIKNELLADAETSGVSDARLSQPLCTAVQIVLVDLLRKAGIKFQAVVGHSSGEIAAAYAAGLITAHDPIRIAYQILDSSKAVVDPVRLIEPGSPIKLPTNDARRLMQFVKFAAANRKHLNHKPRGHRGQIQHSLTLSARY